MSIIQISFDDAQANFAGRNRFARWFSVKHPHPDHATFRLRDSIFRPGVRVTRKLRRDDSIFTLGSCFAREVEHSLARKGYRVLSLVDEKSVIGKEALGGWANRYNTRSMLRELQWASGEREFPKEALYQARLWRYVDLNSHPLLLAEPYKIVAERRRNLTRYFAQAFSASMVTITLGLTECWYDTRLEDCVNFVPSAGATRKHKSLLTDSERFDFRVLDFQENMENLEELFAVLKRHNPRCHIVVTVSPVALTATFTERDVVVANCMSKSTLRACAETWQSLHRGEIDYFPSYEMATMSDRKLVLANDGVHIKPTFVDEIMEHFAAHFIEGAGDNSMDLTPTAAVEEQSAE